MYKILVITIREYAAAVGSKFFICGMLLAPALMLSLVITQRLVTKFGGKRVDSFAVIDRTLEKKLFQAIEAAARKRNTEHSDLGAGNAEAQTIFQVECVKPGASTADAVREQRYELSQRVRQGELAGFLDIGSEVYLTAASVRAVNASADHTSICYQSSNPTRDSFGRWAEQVINQAILARRCQEAGWSHEQIMDLVRRVPVRFKGLVHRNSVSGRIEDTSDEDRRALFLVPGVLMALMFAVILFSAMPLMYGIIEEKSQRIGEMLLGSVRAFNLMMGKLFGAAAVSLTLTAVYLTCAYVALRYYGFTQYLPMNLLGWYVLYQGLAVIMYGSLYMAVGAACTNYKETQILALPIVILTMIPIVILETVVKDPNGALATWVSLFPFCTPTLMLVRLAMSPTMPWWQPLLGAVAMLFNALLCVYLSGRIFRVGFLMRGKGASITDLTKWLFYG